MPKRIIEHIAAPGVDVEEVIQKVRVHVRDKTKGRQTVWTEGSLMKPFFLSASNAGVGSITALEPPAPATGALVFADSGDRLLSAADLDKLDAATLRLARNEILARRGGKFSDPAVAEHFQNFDWYRPSTFEPVLTEIDRQNLALIRQYELLLSAPADGFLFVDSDRRLLAAEEIAPLTREQLRAARNEIYARRGRKFRIKEVRKYFEQFDWYRPQFGEVELTFIEQENVDLIRTFEN